MKGLLRLMVVLALLFGVGALAPNVHALTAQDKEFNSFDDESQVRVVAPSSSYGELVSDTSLSTGVNSLTSTAVPTDKLHKYTSFVYQYVGTATNVRISLQADGKTFFSTIADPTSGNIVRVADCPEVWLSEAKQITVKVTNATSGDDLNVWVHGLQYDMPNPD